MESLKEMPVFSCNGIELPLNEIQKKVIKSVTINYLSEVKKVKVNGLMGFLGKTKTVQEEKSLIINDEQGISLFYSLEQDLTTIRFWNKEEWLKITDYDEETLFKRFVMSIILPYQVNFHIGNLVGITWN